MIGTQSRERDLEVAQPRLVPLSGLKYCDAAIYYGLRQDNRKFRIPVRPSRGVRVRTLDYAV